MMDNNLKLRVFIVLSGIFCFLPGCCEHLRQNRIDGGDNWIYDATLDEFFMELESLQVRKIIICTPDDDNPDDWTTLYEISEPERVKKTVEVLRNAQRGFMPAWLDKMKIITVDKKYIMHFQCDDEECYGDHWVSKEFRELLRQWGFPDPK